MGTYAIILTAKDTAENYTGTFSDYGIGGIFEIIPKALTPAITGTLTKIYDGNQNVNVDVKIVLQDGSDIVEGISAEADSISYNDPNAGDHKAITATGIHITSGNEKGNYTLSTDTATAVGVIEKAELQNVHVEQNGELFYNGKEQSATTKKHADVTFGSSELMVCQKMELLRILFRLLKTAAITSYTTKQATQITMTILDCLKSSFSLEI